MVVAPVEKLSDWRIAAEVKSKERKLLQIETAGS